VTTHSVKGRVAAAFAAVTLVLGMGAVMAEANAGTKVKNRYHKSQSNKSHQKASNSIKNGNNTASANRTGGNGGHCLNIGSGGGVSCDGGDVRGGSSTAVAGNINVPIAVNVSGQTNTANDSDTGQAGGVS
jgi:hypothetical protein